MSSISNIVTECLLTASDFDYIIALNALRDSEAALIASEQLVKILIGIAASFITIAVIITKKLKAKGKKMDFAFAISFVVPMSGMIMIAAYQYWNLPSLRSEVVVSQTILNELEKSPPDIEQACATRYREGESILISGSIALKKNPKANESEVITGVITGY